MSAAEQNAPTTTFEKPQKTITVKTTITREALANPAELTGLPLQEQQAKLHALLPEAISMLKASAIAAAPEVGLDERIGFIQAWDNFILGVEVIVDWGAGAVKGIAVGATWLF